MINDLTDTSGPEIEKTRGRVGRDVSKEEAEELVRKYEGLVWKAAWKLTHDEHFACDLAQEGFRALLRAAALRDDTQGEQSFLGFAAQWVSGAMRRFRAEWRYQVYVPDRSDIAISTVSLDQPDFEGGAEANAALLEAFFAQSISEANLSVEDCVGDLVNTALTKLKPREAEAIRRHYLEGESHRNIAESWGRTRQAVGICITKALRTLRGHMPRKESLL